MPLSVEQFTQKLTASGLMAQADLQSFQAALSGAQTPNSGDDLARELVRAGKLTKYQASAVLQGKIKGLRFGEYVVLDKLGAGGMGVVLKAQHRRMERTVAVKVLPAAAMKDPATVDRFYREVKAAAKLFHPNIVTALDAGEHEGMHFLVMEYVEGRDLSAVVSERGALGLKEAVECTIQAARGLEYAHAHGVVHRDIKPANLLWAKDGSVKILDMGLARLREEGLGGTEATAGRQLTQSGQIMGTVDYMSPEQAEDTRKADHRADIYSLGCTLYRLVTAANPFEGDTLMQKLLAHREKPAPSLTTALAGKEPGSILPGLGEKVDAVFQKMLAKHPDERQQSMTEVIAELQAALAPTKAAPPKRAGAPSRANAEMMDLPPLPARGLKRQETGKRETDKRWLVPLGVGGGLVALLLIGTLGFLVFGRNRAPDTEKPIAKKPPETPQPADSRPVLPVNQALSDALAGKFALEFDGQSYVEIPTLKLAPGEPCTLEFFLSDCGVGKAQNVFEITGDGASSRLAYTAMDGGQINWTTFMKPSINRVTGFYSVMFPSWKGRHHAAFLYSSEKNHAGFFVNGNPIDKADKKEFGFGAPKQSGLLLGARRGDDGKPVEFLIGRLSGIRISRSLRYTKAFEPPAQLEKDNDTLALYRFDVNASDRLIDSSGNNHHGKIVGAKWVPAEASLKTPVAQATSHTPPNETAVVTSPPVNSEWLPPENLGATVNGPADDSAPVISADGLTLLFASDRRGGSGGLDLWMCRRTSPDAAWSAPENLGATVNQASDDVKPTLSTDGLTLLFTSDRGPERYKPELWLSTRKALSDAWAAPTQLDLIPGVAPGTEGGPSLSNDGCELYFHARTESPRSRLGLWVARRATAGEPWGKAEKLPGFVGNIEDMDPEISADGKELYFASCRDGKIFELWKAARPNREAPWSASENLGPEINAVKDTRGPALSADGQTLYFHAYNRTGGFGRCDLWMCRRAKPL